MNSIKKYLIPAYILFLIFSFVYVVSVLNSDTTRVSEKEYKEENPFEIKPTVAYLNIEGGNNYRVRLTNTNSVYDILKHLRDEEGLYFEKTVYTYGTELDIINNIEAPEGYLWKVFNRGSDITYEIEELKIEDEETYTIRLVEEN